MNSLECIRTRRSVRKFTEQKVPHELLEELVETARFAPSWKNTQIVRYIAVEDAALKARIAEEATIPWNAAIIGGAPVLMVVTYLEGRCGYERDGSFSTTKGDRWQNFDCGVAAQTFALAAHEKGLGSVILGIFEEKKLAGLLELPEGQTVACLIPLGYPAEEPAPPKRKEVSDLLSYK
ncbi:MAG: nitroreductase family protein [Angelakisella sp.]